MLLIWLIVWLISGCPKLRKWNNWAIGLVICAAMDFVPMILMRYTK